MRRVITAVAIAVPARRGDDGSHGSPEEAAQGRGGDHPRRHRRHARAAHARRGGPAARLGRQHAGLAEHTQPDRRPLQRAEHHGTGDRGFHRDRRSEPHRDPQVGPFIYEVVYAFSTVKQAKAFMETNRSLLVSCPASDRVNPGNGRTYHETEGKVSSTKIGDDTIAFRQTDAPVDGESPAVTFDDAYTRRGNLVLSMAVGGAGINSKLTARYTRKALDKLAAAIKSGASAPREVRVVHTRASQQAFLG